MEIKWTDTECTDTTHPRHSVWRRATVGACTFGICKTRMDGYATPWLASASVSDPFSSVDVHRETEEDAIDAVIELARRCGMIE